MDPLAGSCSRREQYPYTGHFREKVGYGTYRPVGRDDWLIIYTLSGAGQFGYPGGSFVATAHDVVLIRPGAPHSYHTDASPGSPRRWELLWAHFLAPPHWHDLLDWPTALPGIKRLTITNPQAQKRIIDRLAEAHRVMSGYWPRQVALANNALEAALLWCDTQNPAAGRAKLDPRIRQVMDHMSRRLNQRLSLAELAGLCHLSPSRFAHLFKQQTGQTPVGFLEQQRISRARQLLELTSHPVKQVALEVGYDNPFYFTRRFTRATGQSPRAYRDALLRAGAGR